MLRKPLHVGEIAHGDRTWPGLHPPIVGREWFDRLQATLSRNVAPRRGRATRSPAVLTRLIRDALGTPMSPVTAGRDGRRGYCLTGEAQQGRRSELLPDG